MKNRSLFFGIILMLALLGMLSCNEHNEYSLGDFRVDIATAEIGNDGTFSLTLDDGTKLWPAASDVRYLPEKGQRVFVNYTILSDNQNGYDHFIKINDIWDILTKKAIVLTAANADSIGNDPVKVNDMWISNDFLNVDFMFNYGGVRPHAINLVRNALDPYPADGKIHLEFRHNAYQSANSQLYQGFVCFDLRPFKTNASDSVSLSIKVLDWDGEKDYELVYRYNEAVLLNAKREAPVPVISSNEYY